MPLLTNGNFIEATGLTYGTNGFYQKYSSTELAASFEDSAERSVYTVTANGNCTMTDTTVKKIGTASLQLDGTGDYLSFPDNSFVWGTGDFTMEAWIKFGTSSFYRPYRIFQWWNG